MNWIRSRTSRERGIIVLAIASLVPIMAYELVIVPAKNAFAAQTQTIEKLTEDYKTVPFILDRYRRFQSSKDRIETEFRQVEIKEGEQSLLEGILSGKVDDGFVISPGQTRAFGGEYEQAGFNVRFTTGSVQSLANVLTDITTGNKRMLITSITVTKDPNGDKLRIEAGVSSIRRLKGAA